MSRILEGISEIKERLSEVEGALKGERWNDEHGESQDWDFGGVYEVFEEIDQELARVKKLFILGHVSALNKQTCSKQMLSGDGHLQEDMFED